MPPTREPWIKVRVGLVRSDKVAGLPSDAARWGYVRLLCEAKLQRRLGVFQSRRALAELLGSHARYIEAYVTAGLLHDSDSDCKCIGAYRGDVKADELVVHDFRQEQRDPTAADRMADYRDRIRGDDETPSVTANETIHSRALSPSPSSSSPPRSTDRPKPRENGDAEVAVMALAEDLTGQPYALPHLNGPLGSMVRRQLAAFGLDQTTAAWRAAAAASGAMPTIRQIVLGADDALSPVPRLGASDGRRVELESTVDSLKRRAATP